MLPPGQRYLLAIALVAAGAPTLSSCTSKRNRAKATIKRLPAPVRSKPVPRAPRCLPEPWPTYGHDARRSGATNACCGAVGKLAWERFGTEKDGREPSYEHTVIGADGALVGGLLGKSSTATLYTLSGLLRWRYDSRADLHRADWPVLAHKMAIINDDGLYMLRPQNGKSAYHRGLDSWGQLAPTPSGFFMTNTWHVEGPGVFVARLDKTGKPVWKRDKYGSTPQDVMDLAGGLAVGDGVVVHTANYRFAKHSALSAFDADKGKELWRKRLLPHSAPSIANKRLFLVTRKSKKGGFQLKAYDVRSGKELWASEVPETDEAAPLLAKGKVFIFAPTEGVLAFDQTNGKRRWAYPVKVKLPPARAGMHDTQIAASLSSNLVWLAANSSLIGLNLESGKLRTRTALSGKGSVHSPVIGMGHLVVTMGLGVRAYTCRGGYPSRLRNDLWRGGCSGRLTPARRSADNNATHARNSHVL